MTSSINKKLAPILVAVSFLVFTGLLYGGAKIIEKDSVAEAGGGSDVATGDTASFTVVGENISFDKKSLVVSPGAEVTLTFDNRDAGVVHNIHFYTTPSATTSLGPAAQTPLEAGPRMDTTTFKAPARAGSYFFRCDAHPDQMRGVFLVR